jgi:hypothetical protein
MSVIRNGSICLALLGVGCGGANNRINLDWKVLQQADSDDPAPGIAGVEICVDGHAEVPCVTTDAQGAFTLRDLPSGSEIVLVLEKDGYVSALKPIETSFEDSEALRPITMSKATDAPPDLGFDIDTKGAGSIDFFIVVLPENDAGPAGPISGATATLSPAAGEGAIYFAKPGVLDPTLEATLSSGGNFDMRTATSGRFFNVPPGDYTVNFTPPPKYTCTSFAPPTANFGFPVPDQPAVRVPVRAGYNTANIGVSCALKR